MQGELTLLTRFKNGGRVEPVRVTKPLVQVNDVGQLTRKKPA